MTKTERKIRIMEINMAILFHAIQVLQKKVNRKAKKK
jgi:hypothetical protein